MNSTMNSLFLALGSVFSLLAAVIAYLILYGEYVHHFQGDTKRPRKMALEGAFFTFIIFFLITLLGGYVLTNYIINK